jgi:WW domain-containing oxidoreductase
MTQSSYRFGKTATADDVLQGLDLTGKTFLVTGCATGIGFESMRALAAHGAHVIGTARTLSRAAQACAKVQAAAKISGKLTPIACDQDDFASVAEGAQAVRGLGIPLDAIIANAGIMAPPAPNLRYGVESQFRVNHLSHMLLVTRLADLLRDGTGRLVMVSSSAAQSLAPREGVMFDNLDAHRSYRALTFYGQSKLANLTFAKSMAERLRGRGIASNAIHPGVIVSTDLPRHFSKFLMPLVQIVGLFGKNIPQGAATQCYVAAHPDMAGATGGFYADCQPLKPNWHANDKAFQERLWAVSEKILAEHGATV